MARRSKAEWSARSQKEIGFSFRKIRRTGSARSMAWSCSFRCTCRGRKDRTLFHAAEGIDVDVGRIRIANVKRQLVALEHNFPWLVGSYAIGIYVTNNVVRDRPGAFIDCVGAKVSGVACGAAFLGATELHELDAHEAGAIVSDIAGSAVPPRQRNHGSVGLFGRPGFKFPTAEKLIAQRHIWRRRFASAAARPEAGPNQYHGHN